MHSAVRGQVESCAEAAWASCTKRCLRAGLARASWGSSLSDGAVEMAVERLVHHTHAAFTEFSGDSVMRQLASYHGSSMVPHTESRIKPVAQAGWASLILPRI